MAVAATVRDRPCVGRSAGGVDSVDRFFGILEYEELYCAYSWCKACKMCVAARFSSFLLWKCVKHAGLL